MHGRIPVDTYALPRGPPHMAKKKTESPQIPATQEELLAVRLYLPAGEDHKKLRRLAADEETKVHGASGSQDRAGVRRQSPA